MNHDSCDPVNSIPSFDVVDESDTRFVVRPATQDDTVGQLAAALGLFGPPLVDGAQVSRGTRLIDSGIRHGSLVEPGGSSCGNGEGRTVASFTVIGGPACRQFTLAPGRHGLGRAPENRIRILDPMVEPFHALIDVGRNGTTAILQIAGKSPIGRSSPGRDRTCVESGVLHLAPGDTIDIGSSVLEFGTQLPLEPGPEPGRAVRTATDPWRRIVHRAHAAEPSPGPIRLAAPSIADPPAFPPPTALIGAATAVIAAGVIGVWLGSMLFALFAAVGAVASFATWAISAISVRRRRRRCVETARAAVEAFGQDIAMARAHVRSRRWHDLPPLELMTRHVHDRHDGVCRVWERRRSADGLTASIGRGTSRWDPPIDGPLLDHAAALAAEAASTLVDVPIGLTVDAHDVIAVRGQPELTSALIRSVVAQLAIGVGPSEWSLIVATNAPDRWSWASWLPHHRAVDGRPMLLSMPTADRDLGATRAALARTPDRLPLVIVGEPTWLSDPASPLRHLIDETHAAVLVDVGAGHVPTMCRTVLDIASDGTTAWSGEVREGAVGERARMAGIEIEEACRIARSLTSLVDPDDVAIAANLPDALGLGELDRAVRHAFDADPRAVDALVTRWGRDGDPPPAVALGVGADGPVVVDLVRDGPHGLVAGTTGSGKSELLRTLVFGLAATSSPRDLNFVLIDYKGGATFDSCGDLPHTVGLVTDLDGGLGERALASLRAELTRREDLLRRAGADDLTAYRRSGQAHDPLARLVVVVDEFAALAQELPEVMGELVGIAQRGRSLGIHLVLATQRPGGVIDDDIRANVSLRIALRLNDARDALDVVGDERPATFARRSPGRALVRLGPDELIEMQAAVCAPERRMTHGASRLVVEPQTDTSAPRPAGVGTPDTERLVRALLAAHVRSGHPDPHRPWLDPLPLVLTPQDVDDALDDDDHDAVGLVDDPERQARRALRWDRSRGNLALVGAIGSGVTSTMLSLLGSCCRGRTPSSVTCFVIDGRGDTAFDSVSQLAHCGGVVRPHETERLVRLIGSLADGLDQRRAGSTQRGEIVVFVDGIEAVRSALADVDHGEARGMLDRLLEEGPGLGIHTCWSTGGSAPTTATLPRGEAWVGRLDDPATRRMFGLAGGTDVCEMPGRFRSSVSGLEVQVAHRLDALAGLPGRNHPEAVEPIRPLPAIVAEAELSSSSTADDHVEIVLGLDAHDLSDAALVVPARDHVFIGGGSGSGKSSALATFARQWSNAFPAGDVVEIGRRRRLPDRVIDVCERSARVATDRLLVVADDADRIADDDGGLARLIATSPPAVTIVAAARVEAIRAAYGHWVREIVRSRCGILLSGPGEVDGELLGVTVPRRSLVAARPGLGWLVDRRGLRLVQLATTSTVTGPQTCGSSPRSQRGPTPRSAALSSAL